MIEEIVENEKDDPKIEEEESETVTEIDEEMIAPTPPAQEPEPYVHSPYKAPRFSVREFRANMQERLYKITDLP